MEWKCFYSIYSWKDQIIFYSIAFIAGLNLLYDTEVFLFPFVTLFKHLTIYKSDAIGDSLGFFLVFFQAWKNIVESGLRVLWDVLFGFVHGVRPMQFEFGGWASDGLVQLYFFEVPHGRNDIVDK